MPGVAGTRGRTSSVGKESRLFRPRGSKMKPAGGFLINGISLELPERDGRGKRGGVKKAEIK